MKPARFIFPAEKEVDRAVEFYLLQSLSLAEKFLVEVARTVKQIAMSPEAFGLVAENVRMKLVSRFSYAIYYRVLSDEILILSVAHTSQKPKDWEDFSLSDTDS